MTDHQVGDVRIAESDGQLEQQVRGTRANIFLAAFGITFDVNLGHSSSGSLRMPRALRLNPVQRPDNIAHWG